MAKALLGAVDAGRARDLVRERALLELDAGAPHAPAWYAGEIAGPDGLSRLRSEDLAAIRLLDYCDNAGTSFEDPSGGSGVSVSEPIGVLWGAMTTGSSEATEAFFLDWLHLLRQVRGELPLEQPPRAELDAWMARHPVGTEAEVVAERVVNRERILNVLLEHIEDGRLVHKRYRFSPGMTRHQKLERMRGWWQSSRFHLTFAIRDPVVLNEMLDYSLSEETLAVMERARTAGIPVFVNPYYLSLLLTRPEGRYIGADLALRQYVLYSQELVTSFGSISAWEKEDEVEFGKPNAAGWLLPGRQAVHRRYPEVAILIPETVGRACGGLCAVCQRMYDFQSGHLSFNLEKLEPEETWPERLRRYMDYFESDSQLRDILITGGDALMSSNASLRRILDAALDMAHRKIKANAERAEGEKFAEMVRIRLGTRLPVYLPQRITESLAAILAEFRGEAAKAGFKQFIIQTHFESAMEITPEAVEAIRRLNDSGWTVTNQLVFTTAASRRGHSAELRKALNDVGVLTYYTFAVKGHSENRASFTPNARAVQEQMEEKCAGVVPERWHDELRCITLDPLSAQKSINNIRAEANLPFLATDRNVLNLPGVGKSLTFRTIGLTNDGRRVQRFDHDHNRRHSPIIDRLGMVPLVESKSIADYLAQLKAMGENPEEYATIWGYSIGETEPRLPLYKYPPYPFEITARMSNLDVDGAMEEEIVPAHR